MFWLNLRLEREWEFSQLNGRCVFHVIPRYRPPTDMHTFENMAISSLLFLRRFAFVFLSFLKVMNKEEIIRSRRIHHRLYIMCFLVRRRKRRGVFLIVFLIFLFSFFFHLLCECVWFISEWCKLLLLTSEIFLNYRTSLFGYTIVFFFLIIVSLILQCVSQYT